MPVKPIFIIIGLIIFIWLPFLLGYYDALTAVFVTAGSFIGGYFGEKMFRKKD